MLEVAIPHGRVYLPEEYMHKVPEHLSFVPPSTHLEVHPSEVLDSEVLGTEVLATKA